MSVLSKIDLRPSGRGTSGFHRRGAVVVATAVASTIFAGAGIARATAYTITVDAATQTAGNPHFWSASVGTGTASLTLRSDLQTHYKLGNRELGMQRVRGHGVFNDDMGVYKAAGSYDWTKFDKYLDAIVSAGMRPVMELSFMPTALAKNGNSKDPPKDYSVYKTFIQAVVQHCVDKYGAADVGQWYFEVWNEPDYAGFWNGTISDYYTLYDNAVDGATAVLPNVIIGGPGTTEPGKIAAFLQHCKTANKRVTFASSHNYPGGASTGKSASGAGLVNDNNTRISQITSGGYTTATVKSVNTEWNSSYSGQGGGTGDVLVSMDNHWNAGFILKSIKLLSDKNSGDTPPGEIFSYWVLSDVFDESSGPSGSYILSKGGTLPFGSVFGLMTFQGVRKAAYNAFKMLNYLGPKRLKSGGGTGSDGVDAMATMSASGDELQILVYDYYATLNSSGTDSVTVTVSNLPASLSGKELFVTHFGVDETHSNPYSVWATQGKPTAPSETQWQAMKQAQHLALLEPVTKMAVTTSYTTTFTMPRQAGSLIILGVKRPVTGRNALVEIEGEDYDGQSGATKDDSNDVGQGQSLAGTSGGSIFFDNVDFSDAGVSAVQLRVNAQSATTLQLHADSATGPLVGTCQIAATAGAWATQTCTLTATTGVHDLYVGFGGAVRLNWMKFQQAGVAPGTGGVSGGSGGASGANGSGGVSGPGTGGAGGRGTGGSTVVGTGGAASGTGGASVIGTGGTASGSGGSVAEGSGGSTAPGSGGASAPGTGSGGSSVPSASSGKSGCACGVGEDNRSSSGAALILGLATMGSVIRRKRAQRRV